MDDPTAPPADPAALAPAAPLTGAPAPGAGLPSEAILDTSEEEFERWKTRVTASREIRDGWKPIWQVALDKCQPPTKDLGDSREPYDVNTLHHFRTVRQKYAGLWAQDPDIVLEARAEEQNDAIVATHAAGLNTMLGPAPNGVGAGAVMHQNVLDALTIGGMGWARLGWDKITVAMPPPAGMEALVGAEPIPVPVYEAPYLRRIKPGAGLVPADAEGSDPDQWAWIGHEYGLSVPEARRVFNLGPDVEVPTTDKAIGAIRETQRARRGVREAHVVEIHYYASRERADVAHPKIVHELVWIEGMEKPVRHRRCPYQEIDPMTGLLTPTSVDGYTIDVLVLRDEAEGAIGASDAVLITPLAEEESTFRSQMIRHRDAAIPIVMFKESALTDEQRDRLRANDYFNWVVIADADWPAGAPPIMLASNPSLSRDSFAAQDVIARDIDGAVGASEAGSGQTTRTRRSATESQYIAQGVGALRAVEQARVAARYVRRARKLDAVLRRYMTTPMAVKVIGPMGHQAWASWVAQTVSGALDYTMRADSQIHTDAAANQSRWLQWFNQTQNDPGRNKAYGLRMLDKSFGVDTSQSILPPQPPPPPQPKVSVSIKMEDLIGPAGPVAAKLVTGQPVTPEDIALMMSTLSAMPPPPPEADPGQPQGEHGGVAEKTEPIEAHQSRRTGGTEGVGVV